MMSGAPPPGAPAPHMNPGFFNPPGPPQGPPQGGPPPGYVQGSPNARVSLDNPIIFKSVAIFTRTKY